MHSKLLGFTVFLIIFILSEKHYEGLTNMKQNNNEKNKFLKNHCKIINGNNVIVDSCGNELQLNNIKNVYKNLKFNNGLCNPCNSACMFEITNANEKLSVEEKLKAQPSNK